MTEKRTENFLGSLSSVLLSKKYKYIPFSEKI